MWSEIRVEERADERFRWWVLSQQHEDGRCRVRMCFDEHDVAAVRREWGQDDAR